MNQQYLSLINSLLVFKMRVCKFYMQKFMEMEQGATLTKTSNLITHTPSPSLPIILVVVCLIVLVMLGVFLAGVYHLCQDTTTPTPEI